MKKKNDKSSLTLKEYVEKETSALNNNEDINTTHFSTESNSLRKYIKKVKQGLFEICSEIYAALKQNKVVLTKYNEIANFLDGLETEITKNTYDLKEYQKKFDSYTYITTANVEFLHNTYNKINTLINDFRMNAIVFIDLCISKEENSIQNDVNMVHLPNCILSSMKNNQSSYPIVYYTENFLRLYVSIKHNEQYNDYSLKQFFKNCSKAKKSYETNIIDEEKYAWIKERGALPVFYLDFIDLKNIIISNWDTFKTDFPDQAFVNYTFDEFYKIRCKIAHNSYNVQETEVRIILRDSYVLTNQLKKYYDKIKKFNIEN